MPAARASRRTVVRFLGALAGATVAALVADGAALAQVDEHVVIVVRTGDPYLAEHARPVQRGATRALGRGRVSYRRADDGDCVPTPGDASCAPELLRGRRAALLLHASVRWARAGCVPMRRAGETVGHRMLRRPVLYLELYGADGAFLRAGEVELPRDGDADRAANVTEAGVRAIMSYVDGTAAPREP